MTEPAGPSDRPARPAETGNAPPVCNPPPSAQSPPRRPLLIWLAGALGIGGCLCGIAIFLTACAGQAIALAASPVPLLMGALALVMTIVGGVLAGDRVIETTHVLASIFTAVCAMVGGLVEMAAWRGWTTFR